MSIFDIAENAEDVSGSTGGGGMTFEPPREGMALMRMCSYIELGVYDTEWKGTHKEKEKVLVEFELLHADHQITGKDGRFIGNHKVTVRLNKSGFEKSNYMKVFNKLNYDGSVHVQDNKVPSLSKFLGKAFLGQIYHNVWKEKTYANLDKDGEYSFSAPQMALADEATGMPTGKYRPITVPEMNVKPKLFLWESPGMSKANYHEMWDTLYIEGERDDGTSKNWIQELILSPENLALPGSVAEELFVEGDKLKLVPDTDVLSELGIDEDIPF